jgi:acyl-CoA thioester hydrolase
MRSNLPSTIVEGRHHYAVRIYFEDTDAAGVVYHANYLRLAERARTEALRELGVPHAELVSRYKLMFMVRRVELDYVHPAYLDDGLTVVTEPVAVGGASVSLRQEFRRASELIAVLKIQLVCVPSGGGKPTRIPAKWRAAFQSMADRGGLRSAVPQQVRTS